MWATGWLPSEALRARLLTKITQPTAKNQDSNSSLSDSRAQGLHLTMHMPFPLLFPLPMTSARDASFNAVGRLRGGVFFF